jgi:hypothetical protein
MGHNFSFIAQGCIPGGDSINTFQVDATKYFLPWETKSSLWNMQNI